MQGGNDATTEQNEGAKPTTKRERATMIPPVEREPAEGGSILRNQAFLRLWGAQLLSQTAQNGLMFALLVLVTERTGSSIYGSLLVLTFMLPSVLLSIPAGVLVDRWHKRTVLIVTNACRAAIALVFIAVSPWVSALLAVTFLFSSIGQFFTPAEAATIPALVSRGRLISANALFQLTLTSSQFLGLVVLAPALLKLGGPSLFFSVTVVLYLAATLMVATLPHGIEPARSREPLRLSGLAGTVARDIREALTTLHADAISLLALAQLTTSSSLAMLFGLLAPRFVRDVLDISADNAVFVFAPMALGAVLGLRVLRFLTVRLRHQAIVTIGLFGITLALLGLASVELIARELEQFGAREFVEALGHHRPRFATFDLSVLVLVTMAAAVPMGFFYALVNAPAQTIIHERAPATMRGRFLGAQLLLANLSSLVLLLVIGAATDLVGVSLVLLSYAPVVAAVAVAGLLVVRRAPPVGTGKQSS